MTAEAITGIQKTALEAKGNDNPFVVVCVALLEVAYQLAVMNERNAASDDAGVREMLEKTGCLDLLSDTGKDNGEQAEVYSAGTSRSTSLSLMGKVFHPSRFKMFGKRTQ